MIISCWLPLSSANETSRSILPTLCTVDAESVRSRSGLVRLAQNSMERVFSPCLLVPDGNLASLRASRLLYMATQMDAHCHALQRHGFHGLQRFSPESTP